MFKLSSTESFSIVKYEIPQCDLHDLSFIAASILNENGINSVHIYSHFQTEELMKKFICMIFDTYALPDSLKDKGAQTRKISSDVESNMINELSSLLPNDSFEDLTFAKNRFRYTGRYSIQFVKNVGNLILEVEACKILETNDMEEVEKEGSLITRDIKTIYKTKMYIVEPHVIKLSWERHINYRILDNVL